LDINLVLITTTLASFLSTFFTVPLVKSFGVKFNFSDIPDKRKVHKSPMVRIGGVAIFLGFFIGLFSVFFTGNLENISLENVSKYGRILLLSTTLVFLLGLFDDLFKLSPKFRLIFQFVVASFAWFQDLRINSLDLSIVSQNLSYIQIPLILSYFVTVIWIVALINAFNWMDGLDGLATGLLLIAAISYLIIEYSNGIYYISVILSSLIGSASAFLVYNYNPAKILMGDCGSYFLGFNLAVLSFLSSTDNSVPLKVNTVFLIMLIPILDMIYVVINRFINKRVLFYPDQTHFHHRLIASGLNQRQTVKVIWSLSLIFSTVALVIDKKINPVFISYALVIHFLFNTKIRDFLKKIFC
tara:strand:+ start:3460 stop:4527 length:1068 start_codon:yes stop_codon:yes gene_type:complete